MQYEILVTKTPHNGYSARPVALPELVMSGDNEAEALDRVRVALKDFLTVSYVVRIDVETPGDSNDPWLRYGGIWKDIPEPEWQQYLSAIDEFRREIDLQTQDNPHQD